MKTATPTANLGVRTEDIGLANPRCDTAFADTRADEPCAMRRCQLMADQVFLLAAKTAAKVA